MRSHAAEAGAPSAEAFAERLAGRLTAAEGDHAGARRNLAQAIDVFERLGAPWERAMTLIDLGRSQTVEGDRDEGRASWLDARATFERLGAVRDLATVDALLGG
jgi:hypothetical protein